MKNIYYVQVNEDMTPIKVSLTEVEAKAVAYVLQELAKTDIDILVGIEDENGDDLYSNYSEWIKTHHNK